MEFLHSRIVITSLAAAVTLLFGIASAHAEILTEIKWQKEPDGSVFKKYSLFKTPCEIIDSSGKGTALNQDFVSAGLPQKELFTGAICRVSYSGYITWPSLNSKKVITPIQANFVIEHPEIYSEVDPALNTADVAGSKGKVVTAASLMDGLVDGGTVGQLSQDAQALRGGNAGLIGVALGTVLNIGSSIGARQATPAGVAYIRARIVVNGFIFTHVISADIYAASTTKEIPADLLHAAIRRFIDEVQAKEDAFNNLPVHAVATTYTPSHAAAVVVAAPVATDATSAPVATSTANEVPASAVAAPVANDQPASSPVAATVISEAGK